MLLLGDHLVTITMALSGEVMKMTDMKRIFCRKLRNMLVLATIAFVAGTLIACRSVFSLDRAMPSELDFKSLLWNNSKVWIVLVLGGLFLSLPTILLIVLNFSAFGWGVSQYIFQDEGYRLISAVLPHVLPECLSLISAATLGLIISHIVWKFLVSGGKDFSFVKKEILFLTAMAFSSWTMLCIAALLEVFVSHC